MGVIMASKSTIRTGVAVLLALVVAFGLAGCGSSAGTASAEKYAFTSQSIKTLSQVAPAISAYVSVAAASGGTHTYTYNVDSLDAATAAMTAYSGYLTGEKKYTNLGKLSANLFAFSSPEGKRIMMGYAGADAQKVIILNVQD
jgi:hypothetical protein